MKAGFVVFEAESQDGLNYKLISHRRDADKGEWEGRDPSRYAPVGILIDGLSMSYGRKPLAVFAERLELSGPNYFLNFRLTPPKAPRLNPSSARVVPPSGTVGCPGSPTPSTPSKTNWRSA